MNQHLQNILNIIQQDNNLTAEQQDAISKSLKDASKEFDITAFKLDRTEKVKRTTAILLEETIEELEQKRKAVEAQNRELEIETALERVRTVAMSMTKAYDLLNVCRVQFNELILLGFADLRNVIIHTFSDTEKYFTDYDYSTFSEGAVSHIPYNGSYVVEKFIQEIRKTKDAFSEIIVSGKELEEWKDFRNANNEKADARLDNTTLLCYYIYSVGDASIGISTFSRITTEKQEVLKRFRNVFDLAYQRYIDIKKAEAQAREAQIETGLERVRSRSLAMHNTSELQEVIHAVHKELLHLDIAINGGSFIAINSDIQTQLRCWGSGGTADTSEEVILPLYEEPFCSNLINHIKKGPGFFTEEYTQEEKKVFFSFLFQYEPWAKLDAKQKKETLLSPGGYTRSCNVSLHTTIFIINHFGEKFSSADNDILKRFGKVFEQTYTRFLDLQKAEAQAREAEIELALERVRARTMAMQHSDELAEASFLLDSQVRALGIKTRGCAFNIYGDNESTEWFSSEMGTMPTYKTPRENIFLHYYKEWQTGKPMHIETFDSEACAAHYDYLCTVPVMGEGLKKIKEGGGAFPVQQTDHVVYFKYGYLLFITLEPEPDAYDIFIRFAKVFEQTYTRFLDLQKAEAQAKEAQVEAALERVRSRTMAMQKSEELAATAAVLFQQLIALGIEPNRLYISIVKSDSGNTEFWITDEDGSKVSTAFAANMNDNATFLKMYEGWQQQQRSLVIDMQGAELQEYFRYLTSLGVPFKDGLEQKRRVQDIAYFSKGFIGMASPDEQPAETLQLLERFAAVFNLTFTRFTDLKVAEAHAVQAEEDLIKLQTEKKRAEDALGELRATQTQLIQSEKMASLGELTAGIAHEIQNPLNFVNNFSEVSKELLDEMRAAMEKGDTEEANDIMNDIIQNLEKINHHGKRADGIVKGMLQHSRTTGATKELTDINKLADEYLRLAYHGLRAKDKAFNATLETAYDEAIGSINVIPQDIGRVILNLITNAFYAVSEKQKTYKASKDITGFDKYQPTVTISTKKLAGKIQILVADNGNGIPKNIVDKIFQPFFTTKPTGQGTGLGLSLAYDIVKAHAGELKVETKDNEGSVFIISLPI